MAASIEELLGHGGIAGREPPPPIPLYPWAPHAEPRVRVFADKEAAQATSVWITFKSDAHALATPADYKRLLTHQLFHSVFNNRLFKACRAEAAPFYSATVGSDALLRVCNCHQVVIQPLEARVPEAIMAVLLELARVRLFGIAPRELAIAKAEYLADVVSSRALLLNTSTLTLTARLGRSRCTWSASRATRRTWLRSTSATS